MAIYCTDYISYNIVTMCYMVVTVFEYRYYNNIKYDILCGVLDVIVHYSS